MSAETSYLKESIKADLSGNQIYSKIFRLGKEYSGELANLESLCFSDPWSASYLSDVLKNSCSYFFGMKDSGIILGYCGIYIIEDECEIINLAVHPDKRRLGIGKALMTCVHEQAKILGAAVFYLECRKSNTAAFNLYKSLGYEKIGIRRNYYKNPSEDAILMNLHL